MFGSDRSHKTASAPLALRNIDDNLCFTRNEAWAWFVLPTQPWAFRSALAGGASAHTPAA